MKSNVQPPYWAHWLLTKLHPEETLEEVEGYLDELYVYWYLRAGRTQAECAIGVAALCAKTSI